MWCNVATLCAIGILTLSSAGCATRPTSATAHVWAQPCDDCMAGLTNFTRVSDKLWRGAQPDPRDPEVFRKLAARGVKTVINLRHDHDDFPDLQGTKLAYMRIRMRGWRPREDELVLFLAALRRAFADPDRWPVLVHCAEGKDRTGYAIASYRIIEEGWDPDSAIQEMFDFRYHPRYFGNPAFLQRLGARRAEIAERVARSP